MKKKLLELQGGTNLKLSSAILTLIYYIQRPSPKYRANELQNQGLVLRSAWFSKTILLAALVLFAICICPDSHELSLVTQGPSTMLGT